MTFPNATPAAPKTTRPSPTILRALATLAIDATVATEQTLTAGIEVLLHLDAGLVSRVTSLHIATLMDWAAGRSV